MKLVLLIVLAFCSLSFAAGPGSGSGIVFGEPRALPQAEAKIVFGDVRMAALEAARASRVYRNFRYVYGVDSEAKVGSLLRRFSPRLGEVAEVATSGGKSIYTFVIDVNGESGILGRMYAVSRKSDRSVSRTNHYYHAEEIPGKPGLMRVDMETNIEGVIEAGMIIKEHPEVKLVGVDYEIKGEVKLVMGEAIDGSRFRLVHGEETTKTKWVQTTLGGGESAGTRTADSPKVTLGFAVRRPPQAGASTSK